MCEHLQKNLNSHSQFIYCNWSCVQAFERRLCPLQILSRNTAAAAAAARSTNEMFPPIPEKNQLIYTHANAGANLISSHASAEH